ncbi:M20/M25/M40 family metallo-hydrolase [Pedobacter sp. P351]|uniref:M20/M25/M40 family metallo-hydrolase n=1 Tax=Pedobacter superstes TaxID=3133441 RepID=UPI0030A3CAEC
MKKAYLIYILVFLISCVAQKPENLVQQNDIERIIRTLSADEMQGRAVFTPGIEKAASFIESEFRQIGLQPFKGQNTFRQEFSMTNIKPIALSVSVNGNVIDENNVLVITDKPGLNWNTASGVETQFIKSGDIFMSRYRSIMTLNKPVIIFVDEEFYDAFKRVRNFFMGERLIDEPRENTAAVFIIGTKDPSTYQINFTNKIEQAPLFNIAGIIPGKSKPDEYVIFSGHYDHLGILEDVKGDSIANGADDDASGITAVMSLARYYKKLNNNERTLIFVAFTAEESGMIGSKYFSEKLNPDEIKAMFNIEMIGKESKFGKNSAFITGFDRSDFGTILQKNLVGTGFTFYPDPYKEQQLFYRSDNATLAALGVPAHTISTDQIDIDKFYHTVDDEFETLNIANITATIKAIALSSRGIVAGTETPKRITPISPKTP